ncbi:hypothetical protein BHM03_00010000, partial [Ensete ventricosum]
VSSAVLFLGFGRWILERGPMADRLRDLSKPIDVTLLDATVAAFYGTGSKEEVGFSLVRGVLFGSVTFAFGLRVLESVIKYKWNALPVEQRDGIKNYISDVIVQVTVHEWPAKWQSFIPDLVSAAKSSETICENCMAILKLIYCGNCQLEILLKFFPIASYRNLTLQCLTEVHVCYAATLLYVAVGMKAATTAAAAREKGKSSVAVVLFFFFFFIMAAAKMCSLIIQDAGSKEGRDNGYGEMAMAGNDCCRGGLGCGCRVMAAGVAAGCSGRGEKEAEEIAVAVEVAGKRRRQRPTMGGSGGWRPELAVVAVKKAGGWLQLWGRGWATLEEEETTALDPTIGSGDGGDAREGRHN